MASVAFSTVRWTTLVFRSRSVRLGNPYPKKLQLLDDFLSITTGTDTAVVSTGQQHALLGVEYPR